MSRGSAPAGPQIGHRTCLSDRHTTSQWLYSRCDPDTEAAFRAFSKAVFADGSLSSKTKQLIAVAVAHVTQCPTASPVTRRRRSGRERRPRS